MKHTFSMNLPPMWLMITIFAALLAIKASGLIAISWFIVFIPLLLNPVLVVLFFGGTLR